MFRIVQKRFSFRSASSVFCLLPCKHYSSRNSRALSTDFTFKGSASTKDLNRQPTCQHVIMYLLFMEGPRVRSSTVAELMCTKLISSHHEEKGEFDASHLVSMYANDTRSFVLCILTRKPSKRLDTTLWGKETSCPITSWLHAVYCLRCNSRGPPMSLHSLYFWCSNSPLCSLWKPAIPYR